MTQSSSTSGIFSQGEGQPQVAGNSQLSSNFGNSLSSLPEHARSDGVPVSGGVTNTVLNSVTSSGPSVGASSLVTDANSGLSGGPHLQRSTSINTESYTRLPASPISFSSNNISISGNSIMDRSSIVQQSSNQDPSSQHSHQSQQHQGASSATSLPRMGQVQLSGGPRMPNSFVQDPTMYQLHKKPRLDIKQEDIVQQHLLQQLLQRQDPMNLQNSNSQVQSLIHQQRLRQKEEQILQSMSPVQRVQFLEQQQQHQQLLLRQQLQEQGMPSSSAVKRPYDDGICSRRLMQYLYHQRQRPRDDAIDYWRKFVAEYYSPRAKKRWCLSLYDKVGHHSPGVFPQAAMDTWQCDICGSKSGKGFEATFEALPRLNEIKFSSGVIDELLFLDFPRERRFPSGMMMLEYAKAIQESVYEQLRVVREGQLRIFFTPDLKIFSWEFCARRHEELLPRRLVAPQVNQLLQVAEKCQNTISQSGPDGVSQSDLQANNAMVVTAGRQLARSLELQSLNDFGFPKRYVRCLQIADVVNSMKDLMDFCRDQKKGPIESLKNFPKVQMRNVRETDQFGSGQGLRSDSNSLNKLMTLHHELNNQVNNNQHMGDREAALAYNNYQNMMIRQTSIDSTNNSIKNNTQVPRQQQLQQLHSPYGNVNGLLEPKNQSVPPQRGSQAFQQQMIQQYLRDMSKNNGGTVPQQNLPLQNPGGNTSGGANLQPPSRSNRAASSSNSGSPAHVGHTNIGFGQRALDLPQSSNCSDQIVSDISHEFTENGFFSDLDDDMNFNW